VPRGPLVPVGIKIGSLVFNISRSNLRTDGQTDGQTENIMPPPAGVADGGIK